MTVWPALRSRLRMLPPILPKPTSPSSMQRSFVRGVGSGEQAPRHQEVAEPGAVTCRVTVSHRATDDNGLGRHGEGQLDHRLIHDLETVEEVLRVEAGGDVLAVDRRLDRLARLRLVAGSGIEGERAVGEGELDGGVALGHERDALERL